MASRRPSRKTVEILEQVTNVYAILDTPNEEDQESYIQVYGKCHLETKEEMGTLQQRMYALEHAAVAAPSPLSHSSSIDGIRDELSEMNEHLQDFEKNHNQRLELLEDLVSKLKDDMDGLDSNIDDCTECFTTSMVHLENNMDGRFHDLGKDVEERFNATDRRFDELEKNTDRRFDNVDQRIDQLNKHLGNVDGKLENMQALYKNGIADRFYTMVAPVGVEYQDSKGYTHYRLPPGPPQPVKYYWRLHRSRNYNQLETLHEFYQIPYTDWSTNDDSSDDDDDLDPPWRPSSLEAAIAKFPARAVRALFARLGLVYSKFEEQAEKLQALDQDLGKTAEKRASRRTLPLGTPKSKIRRQSPSTKSTTEPPTSSTESHDSVALVGHDQ